MHETSDPYTSSPIASREASGETYATKEAEHENGAKSARQ